LIWIEVDSLLFTLFFYLSDGGTKPLAI